MEIGNYVVVFAVVLFFLMIALCLLLLFAIPWMYRAAKHKLQSIFNRHKRLAEESDLVSISTDSEKQKLPIDFTDPADSDSFSA